MRLILALAVLLPVGAGVIRAQGGGDTGAEEPLPACTAADVQPVSDLVIRMLDATNRSARYEAVEMLEWRADLSALVWPVCAEAESWRLELWLSNDELLIGTLLLERGDREAGVQAINNGLMALTDLSMMLPGSSTETHRPGAEEGALDGDAVLTAFGEAELPFADVRRNAGPAGGDAPHTEIERITFTLPTIFDGGVGQVLVFADETGRNAWLTYLYGLGSERAGYVFFAQNVVVQLSPDLDSTTAVQFRSVLQALE